MEVVRRLGKDLSSLKRLFNHEKPPKRLVRGNTVKFKKPSTVLGTQVVRDSVHRGRLMVTSNFFTVFGALTWMEVPLITGS